MFDAKDPPSTLKVRLMMKATRINLVVINGDRPGKPLTLASIENDGHSLKVKAAPGLKFLLIDNDSGDSPQNVTMLRVGDDLQIALEGTPTSQPELIVENYYSVDGSALVGQTKGGVYFDYIASDGDTAHFTQAQQSDQDTPLVLGGTPFTLEPVATQNGLSPWAWGGIALLGAGGVALVAHHRGGGNGGEDNGASSSQKPAIVSVEDNFGSQQSTISDNGATDDATPTLNGTGAAGSTLSIYDSDTQLGSVLIGPDGTWSFTPANELSVGQHSLTVVATDPSGSSSASTAPFIISIDSLATGNLSQADNGPLSLSPAALKYFSLSSESTGHGNLDTLQLSGSDQVLDLRGLTSNDEQSQFHSIENFDLTGTGDNTLKLSVDDVLNLGQIDLFQNDGANQVMVTGNAGDHVELYNQPANSAPGTWGNTGVTDIDGVTYAVYAHSTSNAELLVQQGVDVTLS